MLGSPVRRLLTFILLLFILVANHNLMQTVSLKHEDYKSSQGGDQEIYFTQGFSFRDKILFISEKIAENLINNAIPEADGYKWPIQYTETYFNPGFHSGAAGVGAFFLLLYNVTGNTTYLRYAEGAARWIIHVAEKKSNNTVTWCSRDDENCWYLTPDKEVSGIIKFLIQLHSVTKNASYLDYAKRGAEWIINTGIVYENIGAYVLYNPPHQAAFGIYGYVQRDVGTLMIDLYMITQDTRYLDIAKSIGNWIVFTSECDQTQCKWYDDRMYGNFYTIEGTSSIADFLYELYGVTNNSTYLQIAEKLVNWMESQGVTINETLIKFPNYSGDYTTVIWGYLDRPFFPMTPADIFIRSYLITKNTSRLNVARKFMNWITSLAEINNDQARVPFSENQRIYHAWINARLFKFISLLYSQVSDSTYLDFMSKLLNYIINTAVENGGFVWTRPDGRTWITFGGGEGSCAIGYYLLSSLPRLKPKLVTDIKILGFSGEASLTKVPMFRPFRIQVDIYNPFIETQTYKVVLEERTGFIAGSNYGDGDEKIIVTLSPGETKSVVFLAEVYGIPRNSDLARIYVYKDDCLVDETSYAIPLKLDYVSIDGIFYLPYVKQDSTYVPLLVSLGYDFTYNTQVMVKVYKENKIVLQKEIFLWGNGERVLEFNVSREALSVHGFNVLKIALEAYLPEKRWTKYELQSLLGGLDLVTAEKDFTVQVVATESKLGGIAPTGVYLYIEYGGKTYISLLFRNETAYNTLNCTLMEDPVDQLKCLSSYHGWIILESDSLEPVKNDALYRELAFISEITFRRFTQWSQYNLNRYIELYDDVSSLSGVMMSLETIAKFLTQKTKVLLMVVLPPYKAYVNAMQLKTDKILQFIRDDEVLDLIEKMDFINYFTEALSKANYYIDLATVYLSIAMLQNATRGLREVNDKFKPTLPLTNYPYVSIKGEEAIEFYKSFASNWSISRAAFRFLSVRFSDKWAIYKDALKELIAPPTEMLDTIENALREEDSLSTFLKSLAIETKLMYFDRVFTEEASIAFRNEYIKHLQDSILIYLKEPPGQKKLLLSVIDSRGRLTGHEKETNDIRADIPESMYIDLGSAILLKVPATDEYKLVVSASLAERDNAQYDLVVIRYLNGEPITSHIISSNILKGEEKEYLLSSSGADLKISEIEESQTIMSSVQLPVILMIIVAFIAIAIIIIKMIVS